MNRLLFCVLCAIHATTLCFAQSEQNTEKFNYSKPDNRHIVSVSIGNFFSSQGSVLTPIISGQYTYGGVLQVGYEYKREPNKILTSHTPKITIFFPVTNQLFKLGFGYSPNWIEYNNFLQENYYGYGAQLSDVPHVDVFTTHHLIHTFRIDFIIRCSEHIELSGGPILGAHEFSGGNVTINYRFLNY